MDDGTVECTLDLRWAGLGLAAGARPAGDELAACLERFLTATADERTLVRARAALALWHGFRRHEPFGFDAGEAGHPEDAGHDRRGASIGESLDRARRRGP